MILHNAVSPGSAPDDLDVLTQVEAVQSALAGLGCRAQALPLSLDLATAAERLRRLSPAFVFNLVESLGGDGRLIHLAPALLDHLRIPYTGCATAAIFITTDKLLAKQRLRAAGLPTPAWAEAADLARGCAQLPFPCIVKPVSEDASVGVDEHSLAADPGRLAAAVRELASRCGECFAEAYVDGREFNLSLLAGDAGPEVLPPAEIVFDGYPPEKPRIVGYRAKWDEGSFEYKHTVRCFDFGPGDGPLLDSLRELALRCWALFGLRGYARVDYRIDAGGRPWILEVNANPCLSPEAGFAAAAARAGLGFERVVERIVGAPLAAGRVQGE